MIQPATPNWLSSSVDQVDWQTAYTDAAEVIDGLDDDVVTAVAEASQIVEEWAEVAAYLIIVSDREDVTSMMKDNASKTLSGASKGSLNKSTIDDTLDRIIEEFEAETSDPVDEVLENGIQELVERRTTDHTNNTIWAWTVAYEGEVVQYTTTVTKNGIEHFDSRAIQNALYEETGHRPDPPSPRIHASSKDDDGWEDWIAEFIRRHRVIERVAGERTRFVDDLTTYIAHHPAFTSLREAMVRDTVYVDESEGDVYVPGNTIDRFRDDHALNTNECVTELDARDLTSDTVTGVSTRMSRKVNGTVKRRRYWVLDLDSLEVTPQLNPHPDDERDAEDSAGLDPDLPEADPDILARLDSDPETSTEADTDDQQDGDAE